MQWILIALGVILAVVAVFALQNPAVVTVRFLNFEADASVLVVILVAFAAGVFSGILALLPSSIRKSGRMRKMGAELRSLEKRSAKETATAGSARGAAVPSPEPPSSDARPWRQAEAEAARERPSAHAAPSTGAPQSSPSEQDPLVSGAHDEVDQPARAGEEPERRGLGRLFR